MRKAEISRRTSETEISIAIDLDGTGRYDMQSGVGFFDHMVVGEDVALRADNHAAAQAALRLIALVAVEKLEPGVIGIGVLRRCFAGGDTDHCGRRHLRCHSQAAGRNFPRWRSG